MAVVDCPTPPNGTTITITPKSENNTTANFQRERNCCLKLHRKAYLNVHTKEIELLEIQKCVFSLKEVAIIR